MKDLVGSETSVTPSIISGESYGMSSQEAGAFPGSYAPIQGNPAPSKCGGAKKRRRGKRTKNKKQKKRVSMKNKTKKRGKKRRSSKK